ncbi:MAG: AsmA-like C-terminal region-containing protein, partial [Aestuariivirgaceae bacterium]
RYEARLSVGRGRMEIAARVQQLSLPWLLAFAVMPADGEPVTDVKLFAPSLLGGAKGTIAIEAESMTLLPGIAVKGASARLESDGERLQLLLGGLGARGTPFRLTANLAREANELRVRGDVQGGFDLSEIFSAPDGEPVIDSLVTFRSSFSGAGRSPAGLASALSGKGDVTMPNGFVRGIDAASVAAELASSPTSRDIERLLRRGFTGSDLIFSGATGEINIAEGTMTFGPVPFEAGEVRGAVKTIVELASGGIDLSVDVGMKSLADIPPIEVVYAGRRDRLERTVDASELKARLSSAELRQNMEKLEKLQREQMDLFAEEDRQVRDANAASHAVRQASERNRARAEQAALEQNSQDAVIAAAGAIQRERDELRRRAEFVEAQRKA